jgi:putative autoinducer-2 (AI-2) aldolase
MAYRAVAQGAAGVDMGRNIFQSESPVAMIQAVRSVVHDGASPDEAHAMYEELRHQAEG